MTSLALARRLPVCALVAIAGLATACASRPEVGFLSPVAETVAGASEHTVLVATTRERDPRPGTLFNGERASPLDYAELTVSVPPRHAVGAVEWASSAPGNPNTDFVVRQAGYLNGDKQFIRTLNAELAKYPRGKRKVFVFIHGYNTMFAEGLYRFTQVVHDSGSTAVPVLFTWASRGALTEYVYDNNSATTARDDLEHTFRLLFASDADQINILAHSMGNWVTVEALRQIKIAGGLPQIDKLGSIFLAAPDIDIDVFKSQMRRFGKPRKPSRSGRDLPLVAQRLAFVTVIGRRRRRGRSRIDNRHVRRLVSDVEIAGLENFASNVACSGDLPHRMEVYGHSGDSGAVTRRSEVMRGQ